MSSLISAVYETSKMHCFPKRISARASSSESLEGSKPDFSRSRCALFQNIWHSLPRKRHNGRGGLGTYSGVLIPTCENMWGVLIFLRFFYILGNAGVWQTLIIVLLSFVCALLTTMSLSAIATNGPIEDGGTYYLISRALGPKIGGAVGCMYYLGVVLLSVLEVLGSVEMITFTFPALGFPSANRVIGAVILLVLFIMVFFGIKFVSKLGLMFFGAVLYTMLSYYIGLGLAPRGKAPTSLTGLSWTTFKSNWSPAYIKGHSFSSALSLFFPCFTGILSGADRATNLREPENSIPAGTLGAVVISFFLYLSYMGLWAAVGTRQYLLGDSGGEHAMLMVVKRVAFPLPILTQIGIMIAAMAQAMQCLMISPRLLQAIAGDGVVPFLDYFAQTSKDGEPRKALMLTTFLCLAVAMIGSLDAVGSACLNLFPHFLFRSQPLLLHPFHCQCSQLEAKWKYYHWSAALVGFVFCAAMNFVILWYWAVVAVVLMIFIYGYIDFRQGQGLCVVTVILEGKLEEMPAQIVAEKVELENCMSDAKVTGFGRVLVAPSYREGKTYAIQSSGIGSLEPNTLVLGWPTRWREQGHDDIPAQVFLETLVECKAVDKAVLVCMHLNKFPSGGDLQEGVIDVWWIVHDGGLLLLLAHLLQQHKIWRKCRLRVHTVAEKLDNSEEVGKNLEKLLEQVRIEADVQVLELDTAELAPYTFDYTIRMEEARAFAEVVAKYRKNNGSDNSNRQATKIRPGDQTTSTGKPNIIDGDIQKVGDKVYGVASSQLGELEGASHHVRRELLSHRGAQAVPALALDGTSGIHLPLIMEKSHEESPTYSRESEGQSSPSGDHEFTSNSTIIGTTTTPVADIRDRKGSKEKAGWADEAGRQLERRPSKFEIVVDNGSDEDAGDDSHTFEGQMEPHGSSQVYPGSPAEMTNNEVPEPMRRTWETFSQSYSPKKLNELILEQSKDAQLVLLNLPDHYKGMEPICYMEYCEELTHGLQRVLLVHGTGKELWGRHGRLTATR